MPPNPEAAVQADSMQAELYFLIARFLQAGPFRASAATLISELEQSQTALTPRLDWRGVQHPRTFAQLAQLHSHIPDDFLLRACTQLKLLFERQLNLSLSTLLGTGQFSIMQDLGRQGSQAAVYNQTWVIRTLFFKYRPLVNKMLMYSQITS